MFLINVVYTAPLAEVDAHRAQHLALLKEYYAQHKIFFSGRKIPGELGGLVFCNMPREEVEGLIARDPYHTQGVAQHNIIEFTMGTVDWELIAKVMEEQ